MRLSNAWTTVAIVIVAVSGFGLVPAVAHGASALASAPAPSLPSIHPHPTALDGIYTTDQYGGATTDYYVGLGSSQVAFVAYDFTADGNATVTIHDLNHTRDGLMDPVWSHRIAFHGGSYNYSAQWNLYYQIPLTLAEPGTWNITINGTLGGFYSTNFTVHTYYVNLNNGQSTALAGHSVTESYWVLASINNAGATGLTAITVLVTYFKAGNWTAISGFPESLSATAPIGTFTYTVPANTTGTLRIVLWANISATGVKWSEQGFDSELIYSITTPLVSLTQCPQACGGGTFQAGSMVYLTVTTRSSSGGGGTPQPGLHVQLSFERGSAGVSLPGVPTNFTSNASGGMALEFAVNAPPFGLNVTNYVTVNVTDPLNPVAPAQVVKIGFDLTTVSATPRIQIVMDSATYFGGEVATATWSIAAPNGSAATGWVVYYWSVTENSPYAFVAIGTPNGTASTGTFTFTAPTGYSGTLNIAVTAHNQTQSTQAGINVWVGAAEILLSPNEYTFLPGDTVTVSVSTANLPSSAVLTDTVIDSSGTIVGAGPVTGNQITVHIPMVAPPSYIYVDVVAQDPVAGVITKAYIEVSLGAGLVVVAGVQTKSNYADGSYQPGETVTITYSISTVGGVAPPKWFDITVCPAGVYYCGHGAQYLETASTSGTLSYKIPSNTPTGSQDFVIQVSSISCGGFYYCYNGATFTISVNANPSALQYELGAGSGVTVGWLILLILILVVGLLLFLIGRRRSKGGSGGSSAGPPTAWSQEGKGASSTSTDSSAGTPPASSSSSSSSGAPPLPTPPR
ncbi:MAG: hypothetical protein L3K19_09390 [Thermoplasmata archaeon]|nr:hypothetical protein [Thermoplasmata archaeon]